MPPTIDDFLWHQINQNDEAAVRRSLAEAPTLARASDRTLGTTGLHCASHRGFLGIVQALLDAGADVAARERVSDSTALHWACEGGHPAVARLLVERGAALDPIDSWWGLPPIGWAVVVEWAPQFREDREATIAYLLGAGARFDIFSAVVRADEGAIKALAGAEPNVLARRMGFAAGGVTPLHLALSRRSLAMVALLLDLGADPNLRSDAGLTPLALALGVRDASLEAALRRRGAADDASSAIVRGDAEALASHLAAETSPGRLDALLFAACESGRDGLVGPLVARGANPNARAKRLIQEVPTQATPLHVAALRGQVLVAEALLRAGSSASPGIEERIPTPLHLAAGAGHTDVVRVLLCFGADATATESWYGATPAGWAEYSKREGVLAAFPELRG